MDCIFCKIIKGEMQAEKVYEDQQVIAFKDINPQAPIHLLIIPHKHIATLNDCDKEDTLLMGHIMQVATQLAEDSGISESGYRVVFNCNGNGGQEVDHIHLHLLGGRQMNWPPG